MRNADVIKGSVCLSAMLLPTAFSAAAAFGLPSVLFAAAFALMLAIVKFAPFCKGHEVLWTFLLSFFICIPLNIKLIIDYKLDKILGLDIPIIEAMTGVIVMLLMLTAEELVCCIFVGAIFKGREKNN